MVYQNKKPILENDVVLMYIEEKPSFFARVEKIIADVKPGWWQVSFLMLTVPLVDFTWILDNEQIRGADFTMNGTPMRIEKVQSTTKRHSFQKSKQKEKQSAPPTDQPQKTASILTLNQKK